MYTFSLFPKLNPSQLQEMLKRFHFQEADYNTLWGIYQVMVPLAQAQCWCTVCSDCSIPQVTHSLYAVMAVSLSGFIDEFISLESRSGNLTEAYMADCLALELLSCSYNLACESLRQSTGLWTGRLEFPGNDYPLAILDSVLKLLPGAAILKNEAGMLIPSKSAVYITPLQKTKPADSCAPLCRNCQNSSCPNRNTAPSPDTAKGQSLQGSAPLTYGQQQIFS